MASRPGIGRRLGAFGLDYLVLATYIAALTGAFALLPRSATEPLFVTPGRGQLTAFVVLTAPVLLYFALLEAGPRQATIGKRLLGLRVVDARGGRISPGRSLARSAVKLAPWELAHTSLWRIEGWPAPTEPPGGWPLAGLVLVWVLVGTTLACLCFTPRRRALHDLVAGTAVARAAGRPDA